MKDNFRTILIIDNSVAITGALKAIVAATVPLKNEFSFIYVLPEKSQACVYVEDAGFKTEELPFVELSKRPKDLILYLPYLLLNAVRLKKMIQKHHASVVHVNDFYNLIGIASKLLGARIHIVTHVRFLPHRFIPTLAKIWSRLNLRYANRVISVSLAVRSYFSANEKLEIIPDPLPNGERHPEKIINEQPKEIKLLYLSNYIRGKGQEHVLAAFKEAYKKDKRLRLLFVGCDMGLKKNRLFKEELMTEVSSNTLTSVIQFESFASDVEKKIKEADIVLNFSESESFSLTCLDALYYGTPLIATDCGGPAELFEHGKSGLLVPNKDVHSMTNAILNLAADSNLQKIFSAASKKYVREKFSAANTYQCLRLLYRGLTE